MILRLLHSGRWAQGMLQNTTSKCLTSQYGVVTALQTGSGIFPMSPDTMRLYPNHRWHPPSKKKLDQIPRQKKYFLDFLAQNLFLGWKIFFEMNIFPNIFKKLFEGFLIFYQKHRKIEKNRKKVENRKIKNVWSKIEKSQNRDLNCWNLYIRVINLRAGK